MEARHSAGDGLGALQNLIKFNRLDKASYFYKTRAKDVESIKKKLKLKRIKKPYALTDITDLIGARFLCLFKEDLPILVESIFSVISGNLSSTLGASEREIFFSGSSLVEAVEEAVIYLPNREKDIPYELVIDQFEHQNFNVVEAPNGLNSPEPRRGVVLVKRKEFEYSSIHLIVRIMGFGTIPQSFKALGGIPVEIQIRTAFEDVWAEVDHRTIYKTFDDHDDTNPSENTTVPNKKAFAPIARQLSTILKRHVEACSDSADHIKVLVRKLGDDLSRPTDRPSDSIYPQRIRKAAKEVGISDNAFDAFAAVLGKIYDDNEATKQNFDSAIALANTLCNSHGLRLVDTPPDEKHGDLRRLLNAELALLHMRRGALMRQQLGDDPTRQETSENDFHKAYYIYNSLSRGERDKTDPLIYYRLATLQYFLTGERASALSYLEEAQKRLHDPVSGQWLDRDPKIRPDVMMRLAFEYYSIGEELRTRKSSTGLTDDRQAGCYLRSADIAIAIVDLLSKERASKGLEADLEKIFFNAMNTAVDGTVWHMRSKGVDSLQHKEAQKWLAEASISTTRVSAMAEELNKFTKKTPAMLDTLRNFYSFVGNDEMASRAASEFFELMAKDKPFWTEKYKALPGYLEEMERNAKSAGSASGKKDTPPKK
jgi:ppGpp synthetase/RelA/SpoT-type nucleotidyltranferase